MVHTYPHTVIATFLSRANRFVATCQLADESSVVVHVKNTGRCKELLIPGVEVALTYVKSNTRKTDYDLIAVKKDQRWINIDAQVPNEIIYAGILAGDILLPGVKGKLTQLKREVTYHKSRFDIGGETDLGERIFAEVKGMTLENHQLAAFPDAPSLRALKHVRELGEARREGYHVFVIFLIQFEGATQATIDASIQPELKDALKEEMSQGLTVCAFSSFVTPNQIALSQQVPFDLQIDFVNPNQ